MRILLLCLQLLIIAIGLVAASIAGIFFSDNPFTRASLHQTLASAKDWLARHGPKVIALTIGSFLLLGVLWFLHIIDALLLAIVGLVVASGLIGGTLFATVVRYSLFVIGAPVRYGARILGLRGVGAVLESLGVIFIGLGSFFGMLSYDKNSQAVGVTASIAVSGFGAVLGFFGGTYNVVGRISWVSDRVNAALGYAEPTRSREGIPKSREEG